MSEYVVYVSITPSASGAVVVIVVVVVVVVVVAVDPPPSDLTCVHVTPSTAFSVSLVSLISLVSLSSVSLSATAEGVATSLLSAGVMVVTGR